MSMESGSRLSISRGLHRWGKIFGDSLLRSMVLERRGFAQLARSSSGALLCLLLSSNVSCKVNEA